MSWLLPPIPVSSRPLPLVPGALNDAMTGEGTATCGSVATAGAKRKATSSMGGRISPSTVLTPLVVAPGDYALPRKSALLRFLPKALPCSKEEYEALWEFGDTEVEPTPNPMNRRYNLLRKQATFGAKYRFGAQVSKRVDLQFEEWPLLVRRCVEDAHMHVDKSHKGLYGAATAAHVNWYPNGKSGMGRHRDAEPDLIPGAPIFSYSFSSANSEGLPRLFDLYNLKAKRPFSTIQLAHGDLLIMAGNMQDIYEHGVRATSSKAYANESRINVTVRAFKPGSDAVS